MEIVIGYMHWLFQKETGTWILFSGENELPDACTYKDINQLVFFSVE